MADVNFNYYNDDKSTVNVILKIIYKCILNLPAKIDNGISGITYGLLMLFLLFRIISCILNKLHINFIDGIYVGNSYFMNVFNRIDKLQNFIKGKPKFFLLCIAGLFIGGLPIIHIIIAIIHHIYIRIKKNMI